MARISSARPSASQGLRAIGEFGVIDLLAAALGKAPPPWVIGIGDDAAVWRTGATPGIAALDVLIDGVHFRRQWSRPEEIAHKALAVNASDIAAMGAEPVGALLGLMMPRGTSPSWLRRFAGGLRDAAHAFGLPVVGGDTVRADALALCVSVVGRVPRGRAPLRRDGARPGDLICVTGTLGGAAAGLAALRTLPRSRSCLTTRERAALARRFAAAGSSRDARAVRDALQRHLLGAARLGAGRVLARAGAHAAIDVSDGLASDAAHLARASGLTITLDAAAIPLHPAVGVAADHSRTDPLTFGLSGGDDYELLVAVSPKTWHRARAACARAGSPLSVIGRAARGPARVLLRRDGRSTVLRPSGYDHFQET